MYLNDWVYLLIEHNTFKLPKRALVFKVSPHHHLIPHPNFGYHLHPQLGTTCQSNLFCMMVKRVTRFIEKNLEKLNRESC
jgi:hypothetical protein